MRCMESNSFFALPAHTLSRAGKQLQVSYFYYFIQYAMKKKTSTPSPAVKSQPKCHICNYVFEKVEVEATLINSFYWNEKTKTFTNNILYPKLVETEIFCPECHTLLDETKFRLELEL